MYHSMQPKRGLYVLKSGSYRTAHRTLLPTMLFGQMPVAYTYGSQQVFWLNTYIMPNIHSDVQYCLKCPPNRTVALILACSVRHELAGHLGTHWAQYRKHIAVKPLYTEQSRDPTECSYTGVFTQEVRQGFHIHASSSESKWMLPTAPTEIPN